ncbi:TccC4 [Serratia sp. FS14]|nr:TccC4 [Serratia sp. FS14]
MDGERTYTYDTLSRLTAASGRERLPDTTAGPLAGLQYDLSGGRGVWRRYSEQYDYDDGDNLIRVRHQGVAPWTREMTVLADSNRAVLKTAGPPSLSPDTLFTPGGCQRTLADGRVLSWHADGQMAGVSPVVRAAGGDDREHYQYVRVGERVRKVSSVRVSGGEQRTVVTYAGGMERRQRSTAGGACTLDVVITESGGMRLVEDCVSGSRYIRYALGDRQGSVMGESDEQGCVTAREEYYPYGGSAGGDEEALEVTDRSRRYSGKERDATGLYYYGQRYYQPGLCRWLSADPGGVIDGVNLYRMVRNNPVTLWDSDGLAPTAEIVKKDVDKVFENHEINVMIDFYAQGHESEVKKNIRDFLDEYASEEVTDEELPAHAENVATQVIRGVAQRSVMQDPASIRLTADEKKYVQRFYSTNAGASFINTRARNLFRTRPMAAESSNVAEAIGKGASEGGTDGTPLLPNWIREHVKSAFRKGEPLAVMRAALVDGEQLYAESQYRGTRIPKETLDVYTPGTVIKNVFLPHFRMIM